MPSPFRTVQNIPHRIFDQIRPLILRANYYMGNYQSAVWLIGDGRSGTTLVADIINYNRRYREMFEPFHPQFVKAARNFQMHQFIRPGTGKSDAERFFKNIFSGYMVDPFVDASSTKLLYRNLIIKDIFANLVAKWVLNRFTEYSIKPVLLVRNPFAVALSKYKTKDWAWMTNPGQFLFQTDLLEDYLKDFKPVIESVSNDYIERQILIWSIIHYVPFKQFRNKELYVLFYENLLNNPETEIYSLLQYLGEPVSDATMQKILLVLKKPSRVVGKNSTILQGNSPIESWKKEISKQQIKNGMKIMKTFGLDHIYDGTSTPKIAGQSLLVAD